MAEQVQTYRVEADGSRAIAENERVNKSIGSIGASAERAANQATSSYAVMTRGTQDHTRAIEAASKATSEHSRIMDAASRAQNSFHGALAKAAKGTVEFALAVHGSVEAIRTIGPATAAASAQLERFLTIARAVRVALSPTPVTLLSVAGGYAVGKLLSGANQAGIQVQQQGFISAQTGTAPIDVQRLALASQLSGQKSNFYQGIYSDLNRSAQTASGQTALTSLGFSGVKSPSVEDLRAIGAALNAIEDPAQRATTALALFPKTAGPALQTLGRDFAYTSAEVDRFNLLLDKDSSEAVDKFASNVEDLKGGFREITEYIRGSSAEMSNFFQRLGAEIGNLLIDQLKQVPQLFEELDAQIHHRETKQTVDNDRFMINLGKDTVAFVNQRNRGIGLNVGSAGETSEAAAIADRLANSPDLITSRLSAAKERQTKALADFQKSQTTNTPNPQAVFDLISSAREVSMLKDLQPDTESARRAAELSKSISDLNLKEGTRVYSSIQRGRAFVDKDGNAGLLQLSSTDRINAEHAFYEEADQLRRKAGAQEIQEIQQIQEMRLANEAAVFEKRQNYALETLNLQRETIEKQFGAERDDITSDRDRALGLIDLQGLTGRDAINAKLAASSTYSSSSAILDVEKIQRDQLRKLTDAGFTSDDLAKISIDQGGPRDQRRSAILEDSSADAAAVQRHELADVAQAQRDAAISTAQLTRDENTKLFDQLKNSASEAFDAIFEKGQNVFQAIGNVLKKSILGAIGDIVSSQIAAGIFGLIKPGTSVSFDGGGSAGGRKGGFGGFLGGLGLGGQPTFSGTGGGLLPGLTSASSPATSDALALTQAASPDNYGAGGGGFGAFGIGGSTLASLGLVLGGGAPLAMAASGGGGNPYADPGVFADRAVSFGASPGVEAARHAIMGGYSSSAGSTQGGLFSSAISKLSGGKLNLSALKNTFYNQGSIALGNGNATTAAGIAQGIGGPLGSIAGGLAGFVSSPGAATLGGTIALQGLFAKHQTVLTSAQTVGGSVLAGASLGAQGTIVGGLKGGGLTGLGIGLAADGLKRGGKFGIVEDTAGGAVIGFQYGGLGGAAVGAAIGLVTGLVRLGVKGAIQQIQDLVKKIYNLNISPTVADQIQQIAKASYGGSFSIAVRSQQVIDLLDLYAQATGQPFAVRNKPYAAFLQEDSKGLQQAATYVNGNPYSFNSQAGLRVANGVNTTVLQDYQSSASTARLNGNYYQTPGNGQPIHLSLDGDQTQQLWSGQVVQVAQNQPRVFVDSMISAQQGNYGRTQAAVNQISPLTLLT